MNEFEHDNATETEIDHLLNESLRRRGASVHIGGGTIADVHRRVVRRRRRLTGGVMAAVAIPTVAAAFALSSRDDSGRVASGAAASTDVPDASTSRDVGDDASMDCAIVVTSGSMVPMPPDKPMVVVPNGDGCQFPFPVGVPRPVPFTGGGWRCQGEPDKQEGGWSYYSYCEPTCEAITGVTPTVIDVGDLPSTSIAEPPSTTVAELPSTTIAEPVVPTVSTTIAEPVASVVPTVSTTIAEPVASVASVVPTWASVAIAVPEVAVCMSGSVAGGVLVGEPTTTSG